MNKKVYIAISADILHQGHINLIDRASKLGDLTVGVLTDAAVSSYKRYPLLDFESRKEIISHIKGVKNVVAQNDIDYTQNLLELKPDYVVHGDDWTEGIQSYIRSQVIETLKAWGGQLCRDWGSLRCRWRSQARKRFWARCPAPSGGYALGFTDPMDKNFGKR